MVGVGGRRDHEKELRWLILEAWSAAEWPVGSVGVNAWLLMFKAAGFVSDVDPSPPTAPLTVYRGAWSLGGRGMSWTRSLEKARWFANREALFTKVRMGVSCAGVWVATVPEHAVLATINSEGSRREDEVIVNPNCLRGRATPQLLEHAKWEEESDAD